MDNEGRRLVIGVLIHDFSLGGSERSAIRLAGAWARSGHAVHLLVGNPHGPLERLVIPGVHVDHPAVAFPKKNRMVAALGRWAGKKAADIDCDILFVPGNWHFRAIPALRRTAGPRPAIVAKLSNLVGRSDRNIIAATIRLWSMRRRLAAADRVVAMSDALARDAAAVVASDRLAVIPSPVLERVPDPPKETGSEIVAIGRLVPQKDFALAIEAFACLPRPDLRLTIAGEGPERDGLEALAERLGVSNRVRFVGRIDDVEPLLRTARLLLLTSAYEGYPSVAVEALAMGVPVVATASSPAMGEIMPHPGAGLIAAAQPAAIADAMARLLDGPAPDRAALAASVAHHQMDAVAGNYLSLFRSLAR